MQRPPRGSTSAAATAQTQQSTVALENDTTNIISTNKQTGANAETTEGLPFTSSADTTVDDIDQKKG